MSTRDERYGRRLTDPGAVRALAHPGRYAILERLQLEGPATATECAQVAGLTPSACSYHLRLLARHGFVEDQVEWTLDPAGAFGGFSSSVILMAPKEPEHLLLPGAAIGTALLLITSNATFELVVPVLVAGSCLLLLLQP
jgi:hypothetical protein